MRELGSEFWLEDSFGTIAYALSGRTAIDLILQDLLKQRPCRNVSMPAWCCDSMLQPFADRGIEIQLYDVWYQDGQLQYYIDEDCAVGIFYVANYFGYENGVPVDTVRHYKENGAIVIYDCTHSLFRDDAYRDLADYTFASIRKWLGVPCGAYVSKKGGALSLPPMSDYPYLSEKIEAMRLKCAYMKGEATVNKQMFLDKFGSFGHHLSEDYRNYRMDALSLQLWLSADKDRLKARRKENARFLHEGLREFSALQPMFQLADEDCPLFVPVLFETEAMRDKVRNYLTSHSIYCPIHWPRPACIGASLANDLYSRELSLICDQRYSLDDMSCIIETLRNAL